MAEQSINQILYVNEMLINQIFSSDDVTFADSKNDGYQMLSNSSSFMAKGAKVEQYLAEQAIGLASSLKWEIVQGPFWQRQEIKKQKYNYKGNTIYIESDESQIRDGTYVRTSVGNGVYYKKGLIFDGVESQTDGDLYKQWRNKNLRESLANSSLIKAKKILEKTYFTKGKLQRIASYVMKKDINCLFINCQLKPGQLRNIRKIIQARANNQPLPKGYLSIDANTSETQFETQESTATSSRNPNYRTIKIFDRFSIILQIFAKRATSRLSKLQIQLSYLNYLKTKLARQGSTYSVSSNIFSGDLMNAVEVNLEVVTAKQRRAARIMSGEGQSQLELEKRSLRAKSSQIKKQIQQERIQRNNMQQKTKKRLQNSNVAVIAIVGYTNVGKSALMNAILKRQEVESQDLLFQTLRTTTRNFNLPSGSRAVLLDTIGFITNLPTELFQSFKITLEDISNADVIIHLKDISHPEYSLQNQTIMNVLNEIDNGKNWIKNQRIIEVWNKVDLLTKEQIKNLSNIQTVNIPNIQDSEKQNNLPKEQIKQPIRISATKNVGIVQLLTAIEEKIKTLRSVKQYEYVYSAEKHFKVINWLKQNTNLSYQIPFEIDETISKKYPKGSIKICIEIDQASHGRLNKFLGLQTNQNYKKNKGMPPPGW